MKHHCSLTVPPYVWLGDLLDELTLTEGSHMVRFFFLSWAQTVEIICLKNKYIKLLQLHHHWVTVRLQKYLRGNTSSFLPLSLFVFRGTKGGWKSDLRSWEKYNEKLPLKKQQHRNQAAVASYTQPTHPWEMTMTVLLPLIQTRSIRVNKRCFIQTHWVSYGSTLPFLRK